MKLFCFLQNGPVSVYWSADDEFGISSRLEFYPAFVKVKVFRFSSRVIKLNKIYRIK